MGELQLKQNEAARKVLWLVTREGGVDLGSNGVKTHLPGPMVGIEMRYQKDMGSVRIEFNTRAHDGKVTRDYTYTPVANLKQWKPEE